MGSSMGSLKSRPFISSFTDLVTALSQGKEHSETLLSAYEERGQLDATDKDGKTPLMIVCMMPWRIQNKFDYVAIVEFLLSNGADPNAKANDGNTPMHFACMDEKIIRMLERGRFLQMGSRGEDDNVGKKISVIKLLLKHGALPVQENEKGWVAPCLASLSILPSIVDFFLAREDIALDVKRKAAETLGVSQTLFKRDKDWPLHSSHSFSHAISFQTEETLRERSIGRGLATHFEKVSLKECHTQDELESIKQSEIRLRAHAILVADRLFEEDIKQKYLYPSVASYGCDLLTDAKMSGEGYQVLSCALDLEKQGRLKLGSVAHHLSKAWNRFGFKDRSLQDCQLPIDLLNNYETVLQDLPLDCLANNDTVLVNSFQEVVCSEANRRSNVKDSILESTLGAIEKSLRVLRDRVLMEIPEKYPLVPSLSFQILDNLQREIREYLYNRKDFRYLMRLQFAIRRLLLSETASYVNKSGNTILHLVATCVRLYEMFSEFTTDGNQRFYKHPEFAARDLAYIQKLAVACVRCGCPSGAVNHRGKTAADIMKVYNPLTRGKTFSHESYPVLLASLGPPTSALRLEELSARAIIMHRVDYRKLAPARLCEVIECGVLDLEVMMTDASLGDLPQRQTRERRGHCGCCLGHRSVSLFI